ncbi:hypothetical protein [Piscibacillus salipiscarius]|uniref:DUF3311 domain-containing protein n=1 Tax=Piscibacillus salipiscarius TaxID=299480 RepID=A0ABW5Q827_9BACI
MKYILGTMLGFYLLIFWILPFFYRFLPGDGAYASYFHPAYMGMILLAGLIVACTIILLEEIKSLKEEKNK